MHGAVGGGAGGRPWCDEATGGGDALQAGGGADEEVATRDGAMAVTAAGGVGEASDCCRLSRETDTEAAADEEAPVGEDEDAIDRAGGGEGRVEGGIQCAGGGIEADELVVPAVPPKLVNEPPT